MGKKKKIIEEVEAYCFAVLGGRSDSCKATRGDVIRGVLRLLGRDLGCESTTLDAYHESKRDGHALEAHAKRLGELEERAGAIEHTAGAALAHLADRARALEAGRQETAARLDSLEAMMCKVCIDGDSREAATRDRMGILGGRVGELERDGGVERSESRDARGELRRSINALELAHAGGLSLERGGGEAVPLLAVAEDAHELEDRWNEPPARAFRGNEEEAEA